MKTEDMLKQIKKNSKEQIKEIKESDNPLCNSLIKEFEDTIKDANKLLEKIKKQPINFFNCNKCKHCWSSKMEKPNVCPKCKKYTWNK